MTEKHSFTELFVEFERGSLRWENDYSTAGNSIHTRMNAKLKMQNGRRRRRNAKLTANLSSSIFHFTFLILHFNYSAAHVIKIERLQVFLLKLAPRALQDLATFFHNPDAVCDLCGAEDVVRGDEDSSPARA
jgi:hypothetical protein